MQKVLLICNTDGALFVFRKPIIDQLVRRGCSVVSISGKSRYFGLLAEIGVRAHELDFVRHSVSPLRNGQLFFALNRTIRRVAPDVVHSFTHKAAIYGSIGARLSGVPRICVTITGLGTLFINDDLKSLALRELLVLQYRVALRFVHAVFFQNPDDRDYFVNRGIVHPEKAIVTNGSGIDLVEFGPVSFTDELNARAMLAAEIGIDLAQRQVVLFPARGVREKGFNEYYQAAKALSERYPSRFVFLHLGVVDKEAHGHVSKHDIEAFAQKCGVKYLGFKDNIRDYMMASDIVALPSYREGVPRSLIEALALARTIVTTDAPGCRETVVHGWNGFLCEPKNAEALAEQLENATPARCAMFGPRSRKLCEERFDASQVVRATLEQYGGAL